MKAPFVTIAIAYADPFAREGITQILNRKSNIKVIHEAYSGNDLILLLEMRQVIPDIVVLDGDCGLAQTQSVQAQLAKKYPALKMIVVSSNSHEYAITKVIEGGAMSYLLKTNNVSTELLNAIDNITGDKPYYGQINNALAERAKKNRTPDLTDKEIQFLTFCCQGLSVKQIAKEMYISPATADYYYKAVCSKLGVNDNRIKLVVFAIKAGIVTFG